MLIYVTWSYRKAETCAEFRFPLAETSKTSYNATFSNFFFPLASVLTLKL